MKQMVNERASAIGPAKRTPLKPNIIGKNTISGARKSTCLVRDIKIPLYGFPIDVKKLEASGWKNAVKIPKRNILKYFSQNWKYSSLPVPNMETIWRGNNWKQAQLVKVIIAASFNAR